MMADRLRSLQHLCRAWGSGGDGHIAHSSLSSPSTEALDAAKSRLRARRPASTFRCIIPAHAPTMARHDCRRRLAAHDDTTMSWPQVARQHHGALALFAWPPAAATAPSPVADGMRSLARRCTTRLMRSAASLERLFLSLGPGHSPLLGTFARRAGGSRRLRWMLASLAALLAHS